MQKNQMPKEMENELKTAQVLREESIKEYEQMRPELEREAKEAAKEYEQMRPELERQRKESIEESEQLRPELERQRKEAMKEHAKALLKDGKFRDFLPIPKNLAKSMLDILMCQEGETIYNPFAGIGSFAALAPKNHFVQRDINEQACEMAKLRAEEHKVTPLIEMCDPMQMNDKWDHIIAVPPFIPDMLDEVIKHLYSQLKDGGTMSLLLPASFAYASSYRAAKRLLLDEIAIRAVLLMPAAILPNTGIQTVVVRITKSSVLEKLNKVQSNVRDVTISLCDCTDFYIEDKRTHTRELKSDLLANMFADGFLGDKSNSINVPYSKLKDTGYNLLPQFYLSAKELESFRHDYPMVTLGELLQPVPQEKVSAVCKKISLKDLAKGEIVLSTDFGAIEPTNCDGKVCYLQNGDILVALMGTKLQPTIYSGKEPLQVMLSTSIAALRVCNADRVSPEYIVTELSAPYAQKHVDMFRIGMAQQSINLHVLLDEVLIELPSPEEQQKKLLQRTIETQKRVLEQQGIAYDELLDARRNDYHLRMRARKHAIGQVLNDLDPALDTLMRFMNTHEGTLRATDIVSQRYGLTVSDYFVAFRAQLTQVIQMVNHLTDGEQYGKPEEVYVCALVKKYIDSHPASSKFRFSQVWDRLSSDIDGMKAGDAIDMFQVSIAPEDFFQVMNNIVANAVKYGFTEDKEYCIRISNRDSMLHGQPAVDIVIANNGSPLPKGMTEEKVFLYGASTNGTGIGGAQMKDIIENFGGEIRLNSYPEAIDGYTIEYVITLPVINIQKISL